MLDILLAELPAFGRRHRRIVVPIQAEPHAMFVCVVAGGSHSPGPQLGISDGRSRLCGGVPLPPANIDDHIVKTEWRDIIDERVVLCFGRNPAPLPLASGCKGVPFHARILRILSEYFRHGMREKVLVQAVGRVVQVAPINTQERRRYVKRLTRFQVGSKQISIARDDAQRCGEW